MARMGPVPKRSEERIRSGEPAGTPTTKVDVEQLAAADEDALPFKIALPIEVPDYDGAWKVERPDKRPAHDAPWHPLVANLWESFSRSGEALYWQPSDWQVAALLCEVVDRDLQPQIIGYTETGSDEDRVKEPIWGEAPVKGATLAAVMKAAGSLGLTEGDRRRMGLEIKSRYLDRPVSPPAGMPSIAGGRRSIIAGGAS